MRLKPSVARVNLVADAVSACVHAAIPTLGSDLVFTAIDADLTDGAITLHGVTEFAAAWMLDQYQACRRDDAHSGAGLRSGQGALKEKLAVAPVFLTRNTLTVYNKSVAFGCAVASCSTASYHGCRSAAADASFGDGFCRTSPVAPTRDPERNLHLVFVL